MISFNSISILSLGLGLNLKSYMDLLLIWGSIYPQNIILPNNNELDNQIGNIELNQVQINLFPIFRFSKHEMYLEYHICFDEFADGDEIIIFPICKHIYHTRYITPWLLGLHLIFTIY